MFLLIIVLNAVTIKSQNKFINFADLHLRYQGRVAFKENAAVLSWSGSSVSLFFKGTSITAILKDSDTANYYNIIIDNKVIFKMHTDTIKKSYLLASGLKNKKHKIQLFKRTEWAMGKTYFYGFQVPHKTTILNPAPLPKRKIEFYGNSITCGYALEDVTGKDLGLGYFENNYNSYAASTARYFNAQYTCIAKSGIGITVSWFPIIMPEMYDKLDATDTTIKWDFKKNIPNIVVVNLFQNDSWIVLKPNHPEFIHRFGTTAPTQKFFIQSYENFIKKIRTQYPYATIICALGNMDATKVGSAWPMYIKKAVENINDKKIVTHFFDYKNTTGHPKLNEQKTMANSLIKFIKQNVKW